MLATTALATRTVVIATDAAPVRDRFTAALERAGHRTLPLRSEIDLMARVRADLDRIDLVLLDAQLSQSCGAALVRALRRIDPMRPPVVVFSGTIATADDVRGLDAAGVAGYINEHAATDHILPSLAPHLFPDGVNRRSSPRAVPAVPVAYQFGDTVAAAAALTLSEGGLALRTARVLDVGTTVNVRFGLPDGGSHVDAEATVVWADARIGMGLQFTRMTPGGQEAIGVFVGSQFASGRRA